MPGFRSGHWFVMPVRRRTSTGPVMDPPEPVTRIYERMPFMDHAARARRPCTDRLHRSSGEAMEGLTEPRFRIEDEADAEFRDRGIVSARSSRTIRATRSSAGSRVREWFAWGALHVRPLSRITDALAICRHRQCCG